MSPGVRVGPSGPSERGFLQTSIYLFILLSRSMTKALKENAAVFTAHEEDWLATIRFTMTNLYGQTQSCVFQTSAKHIHPNPHTSHG